MWCELGWTKRTRRLHLVIEGIKHISASFYGKQLIYWRFELFRNGPSKLCTVTKELGNLGKSSVWRGRLKEKENRYRGWLGQKIKIGYTTSEWNESTHKYTFKSMTTNRKYEIRNPQPIFNRSPTKGWSSWPGWPKIVINWPRPKRPINDKLNFHRRANLAHEFRNDDEQLSHCVHGGWKTIGVVLDVPNH